MAATIAEAAPRPPKVSLIPERFDRFLSAAALILLGFVFAALWRGRAEWGEVPAVVWAHIATIVLAVSLTPVMLLRRRGDRLHRELGWVWVSAMGAHRRARPSAYAGSTPGSLQLHPHPLGLDPDPGAGDRLGRAHPQ